MSLYSAAAAQLSARPTSGKCNPRSKIQDTDANEQGYQFTSGGQAMR